MAKLDPVTGPLTRDELKTLAAAPVGAALRAIRKHDPLYGYPPGTKINWLATFVREQEGYAYVKAASLPLHGLRINAKTGVVMPSEA
jgi:hypothetical protein